MIQTIGLIIAVYAIIRLIQVPVEMTGRHDMWTKLPFNARLGCVFGLSVIGVLVLTVLTLMLLFSGAER